MRSTLVSLQDIRCLINILMELKKPFLELITSNERIRDILPKKPGEKPPQNDPNVREYRRQQEEAKFKATEAFLTIIKEGKYFEPHQDMTFYNAWSRLEVAEKAF